MKTSGYSPAQHVFGATPNLPEDLLGGPHAREPGDAAIIEPPGWRTTSKLTRESDALLQDVLEYRKNAVPQHLGQRAGRCAPSRTRYWSLDKLSIFVRPGKTLNASWARTTSSTTFLRTINDDGIAEAVEEDHEMVEIVGERPGQLGDERDEADLRSRGRERGLARVGRRAPTPPKKSATEVNMLKKARTCLS